MRGIRIGGLVFLSLALVISASATTIIGDPIVNTGAPNPNTFTTTYNVFGNSFAPGHGFDLVFDANLYDVENLFGAFTVLSTPSIDWFGLAIVGVNGVLDGGFSFVWGGAASSPVDNGPFVVQFDWLGPPGFAPVTQPFEIVDTNNFSGTATFGADLLESGDTITPEPGTISLLAIGLAAVLIGVRRSGRNVRSQ